MLRFDRKKTKFCKAIILQLKKIKKYFLVLEIYHYYVHFFSEDIYLNLPTYMSFYLLIFLFLISDFTLLSF